MSRTEKKPPGYAKLHLEVYSKKVDLMPLFARFDRQKTGLISQKDFLDAVRVVGLQLSDKEIYDIVRCAELDVKGDIYYRNLLRAMERTQPDLPESTLTPANVTADQAMFRRKIQSDLARGVLAFYKGNSYVGFNRFLINGVFTESSFMEFVGQNTRLESAEMKNLWTFLPSMLSPQVLVKWAQSYEAQEGFKTISEPKGPVRVPPPPAILSRIRNVVQSHGEDYVKTALSTFTYLRLIDLQEVLVQLDVCKAQAEFEEFRLWGVNEGVIHLVAQELAFEGARFAPFIDGYGGEGQLVAGEKSQLGNVVEMALRDMLSAQLTTLKRLLVSETGTDAVTEKHIRRVMQAYTPSLTPHNMSLLLNSLTLVDPPVRGRPFRNFSATEIITALSNWEAVQLGAIPLFPDLNPQQQMVKPATMPAPAPPSTEPALVQVHQRQGTVGQPALLAQRGAEWEQALYTKLKAALSPSNRFSMDPLLAAFHKVDQDHRKVLSLDRFHWTLKQVLPFLSDAELYHLLQVALDVAGTVDERKTAEVRKGLADYLETSKTINRVLFPDGSQYVVSYTFFTVHLEAKITAEAALDEK